VRHVNDAGSGAGKEADGQRTIRELHTDWDFPSVPLSDLMSEGGNAKPHAGELGDIVLVGAKFSDIHPTPFGPKLGVELTASAVETELAGESVVWQVYGWSRWVFKVLLALAIAWLNSRLMPRWATAGTLLLLDESAACCARYPGAYSWVMDNIRKVAIFPVRGKLGLYDVSIPIDTDNLDSGSSLDLFPDSH
jgi:hypothetical protein